MKQFFIIIITQFYSFLKEKGMVFIQAKIKLEADFVVNLSGVALKRLPLGGFAI